MTLLRYNQKRDFKRTPEPKGTVASGKKILRFVVQKHDASHLHYDLRLEMDGVMKSWAVPKGPSMNPSIKRLAVQVEDHPISYNSFEGHIPLGQYGGGDVIVWDKGTYESTTSKGAKESEKEFLSGLKKGRMSFILKGKKLKGTFSLFRFKDKESKGKQWLLEKSPDEFSTVKDVTKNAHSVLSKRILIGKKKN